MIKFRVDIHGKHFRLPVIRRKWLRGEELTPKAVGFYTTRFIEAPNANEARDKVFETLRIELEKDGRTTEVSVLEIEGIREDESGFDQHAPGGGYTFYSEDGSMLD